MNFLGQIETENGTVNFEMNGENFEIRTPKRTFTVYDDDIKEAEGKHYYEIPQGFSGFQTREIEIPAYILDRKAEVLKEIEAGKNSIGSIETTQGKLYFYLTEEGKVKAKLGKKEVVTDTLYTVEGKRVLFLPGLDLDIPFVEIPEKVETGYKKAKKEKESKELYLNYVGRSWLTGKDYYKLNLNVSSQTWNRVKSLFEYLGEGEPEKLGELKGWLTAEPGKVEEILRIKKTVESRKAEIDQQKERVIHAHEKIIQNLIWIQNGFKNAEYPDPKSDNSKYLSGIDLIKVDGHIIRNPFSPDTEWWVLQKDWMWNIKNNSDDLTKNNVITENGSGAIGRRLEPVANVIKYLREIENAL